jgi:hypothetical protein
VSPKLSLAEALAGCPDIDIDIDFEPIGGDLGLRIPDFKD